MKQDQILKSYTFYDNKFRRLSIFGIYNPITCKLQVYILTISKTSGDHFYTKQKRVILNPGTEAQDIEYVSEVRVRKGKDIFSKKFARESFNNYILHKNDVGYNNLLNAIHPRRFLIKTTDTTFKQAFLNFCHNNFFVRETCSVLLGGSNKKITVECYGNSKTHEILVKKDSLKLLTASKQEIYEYDLRDKEERESYEKFEEILNMVSPASNSNIIEN